VEESSEPGKGCFGLDQCQARLYTAILRHIVLVMTARWLQWRRRHPARSRWFHKHARLQRNYERRRFHAVDLPVCSRLDGEEFLDALLQPPHLNLERQLALRVHGLDVIVELVAGAGMRRDDQEDARPTLPPRAWQTAPSRRLDLG
jgi:hypothetical protein